MSADILIVDDEADIRELIGGILEDEGFEPRLAHDSTSALAEIEKRRPALTDNLLQIFSAPLFLVSELAFALGLRFELRAAIERVAEEIDHELTAQGK